MLSLYFPPFDSLGGIVCKIAYPELMFKLHKRVRVQLSFESVG